MSQPSAGLLFCCPEDSTILLAQRSPHMTSPLTWDIFGGQGEEEDEEPIETAFREASEELGCLPVEKKLSGLYVLPKTKTHDHKYYIYIYLVPADEKKNWTPKIKLSQENCDIGWFNLEELPEKTHFDLGWLASLLD